MVFRMTQYEQQHCLVDLVFGWDCRARSDSTHFVLREKVLTDVPVTPVIKASLPDLG
jgi:hypothetical protein